MGPKSELKSHLGLARRATNLYMCRTWTLRFVTILFSVLSFEGSVDGDAWSLLISTPWPLSSMASCIPPEIDVDFSVLLAASAWSCCCFLPCPSRAVADETTTSGTMADEAGAGVWCAKLGRWSGYRLPMFCPKKGLRSYPGLFFMHHKVGQLIFRNRLRGCRVNFNVMSLEWPNRRHSSQRGALHSRRPCLVL